MDSTSSVPPEISARGPLAVEAYNAALQLGQTRVMRVPIMFIGQARSGKTSLKKSIKREKFNAKEASTDGIERDPSYFSVTNEITSIPQTKDQQDVQSAVSFHNRVAHYMVIAYSEVETEKKKDDFLISPEDVESNVHAQQEGNIAEPTEKLHDSDEESNNEKRFEKVPEKTAVCFEKIVNESKDEDEDKVFFTLWDFGGQSVYYATHPIFLTGIAIYLLVYDLSKDPESIADPIERQGVFKRTVDSYCKKTNQDYLHFWLSSVSGLERQTIVDSESTSSEKLPKKLPPVIFVGTHADIAGEAAEDIAGKVYESLEAKPYGKHLSKKYFLVDNTKSGSADECKDVQNLKDELLGLAKQLPHMQQTIPIRWLRFEEVMKSKIENSQPFISLDEARRIARDKCGIDDEEQFETLLLFLHDQRILINFHDTEKLKDLVILDPQWLIDLFRKVITVKRYNRTSDEEQFLELWKKLQDKGVLDQRLVQAAWKQKIDSDKTKETLIGIMEKFGLLCLMPSEGEEKQYLVPSMLMYPPDDKVNELLLPATIPHLFVRFRRPSSQEYVQVPLGLYQRLVVKFLERCIQEQFTPFYEDMYQNFVRLPMGLKGISVILCCNSSSVQIVVYKDPDSSSDRSDNAICDMVLDQLETVLKTLREECFWLKTIECEFSVICPICCQQKSGKYYCKDCKEEESLHFWSESELKDEEARICRKNTLAKKEIVPVEGFAFWFRSLRMQVS